MQTWKTGRLTIVILTDDPEATQQTFSHLGHDPAPAQISDFSHAITQLAGAPFEMAILRTTYQFQR
ncbi:hypothetical protein ACFP3T_00160 [Lactiplantibacillus dongliensis]|uniref:Uncharacterized protein n=1 Tax=Lactiplantibacillus dongliensis TaxID=2559919 RepID=A0ABW1R2G0_9LACO|nr:hypothetical protein [Lactiplantibacillus dongliensis]